MGEGLNPRLRAEVERILRDNWAVDGPFVITLDELASQVSAELGAPKDFLVQLAMCILFGAEEILRRKDTEELTRLTVRMYLSGLRQGAQWQRERKSAWL